MNAPAPCYHCGAPLDPTANTSITCRFCDQINVAPPKEVGVPVPVQIVHNVVNVAGAEGSAHAELRCPRCKRRLVTVNVGSIALSGCGRCGGIWVDNASAHRLIQSPDPVVIQLADRASANAASHSTTTADPTCPVCEALLDPSRGYGITLDVCSEHGTWFDSRELQRMVRAVIARKDASLRAAEPVEMVACVQCKSNIRASHASIGEAGSLCESCWRAYRSRLTQEADESRGNMEKKVGTVLLGVLGAAVGAAFAKGNSSA